uniref:Uncharacterized protein n=1 Tax=Moorena producens (strain JHB) TaxID=1454205 RepID=A0A1D9G0N1_MOOP1
MGKAHLTKISQVPHGLVKYVTSNNIRTYAFAPIGPPNLDLPNLGDFDIIPPPVRLQSSN